MDGGNNKNRTVLPRWRAIERVTPEELRSVSNFSPNINTETAHAALRFLYEKWREHPTLEHAAEVVDSAVCLKNPFLAVGPANAILADKNAMPAVKAVANFVLKGTKPPDPEINYSDGTRAEIEAKIRKLKARAIDEPRNAIVWLEKARLHTLIGDLSGGRISIKRAYGAAPSNRLVLRALARFMVHAGEPEEAHRILKRSELLRVDPWVQAAELVVADIAGHSPIAVRWGRELAENKSIAPIQLSELSSALGTAEAQAGAHRLSNRHFRQSLESPTENALSQAYWAREQLGLSIPIQSSMLAIRGAFEARVRDAMAKGRWALASVNLACTRF